MHMDTALIWESEYQTIGWTEFDVFPTLSIHKANFEYFSNVQSRELLSAHVSISS